MRKGSGFVGLVGLERDLQDAVSQPVPVETGDGHGCLVVVSHGDKSEPFALVCVEVPDDLDVCDGAKRPKHLPQNAFVCIRSQVIDEDAPAGARVPWDVDASQAGHPIDGHGGEPAVKNKNTKTSMGQYKTQTADEHH